MFTNAVIDISHYEEPVDFNQVLSEGIVAVISKATNGPLGIDKTHTPRRTTAKGLGLLWGSYHFGTGEADGVTQAKHFLAAIGVPNSDLISLDFEPYVDSKGHQIGPNMTLSQAVEFVQEIKTQLGRYPFLYGGSLLKEKLGDHQNPVLAKCPLWLAQYPEHSDQLPTWPKNWKNWTLWQYTDGSVGPEPHTVMGIGRCDRNQYIDTQAHLVANWPLTK